MSKQNESKHLSDILSTSLQYQRRYIYKPEFVVLVNRSTRVIEA